MGMAFALLESMEAHAELLPLFAILHESPGEGRVSVDAPTTFRRGCRLWYDVWGSRLVELGLVLPVRPVRPQRIPTSLPKKGRPAPPAPTCDPPPRTCKSCSDKLPTGASNRKRFCASCARTRRRRHTTSEASRLSRQASKQAAAGVCLEHAFSVFKTFGGCVDCGNRDYRVAHWHHTDPSTKTHSVSRLMLQGRFRPLVEELAKCIPLCANCHTLRHAPEFRHTARVEELLADWESELQDV